MVIFKVFQAFDKFTDCHHQAKDKKEIILNYRLYLYAVVSEQK